MPQSKSMHRYVSWAAAYISRNLLDMQVQPLFPEGDPYGGPVSAILRFQKYTMEAMYDAGVLQASIALLLVFGHNGPGPQILHLHVQ